MKSKPKREIRMKTIETLENMHKQPTNTECWATITIWSYQLHNLWTNLHKNV